MCNKLKLILLSLFTLSMTSCVFEDVKNDPVPYNADQIKYSNLIVKVSFEDKVSDELSNITNGIGTNITYVQGIKGKAYQGGNGSFISYNTVSQKVKDLRSVTIALWVKTAPHSSGAQSLYMFAKETTPAPFWGNAFTLIESNTNPLQMPVKNFFSKRFTSTYTSEQWINHLNQNAPQEAYNKWTHLAWTYDGTNSRYYFYVNGQNITPDSFVSRSYLINPDDEPLSLGFLNFEGLNKLIIGGFQQNLGAPWSAPESWMKTYTGAMDEFRIYNAALTPQDIFRLYSIEKEGL